MGGGFGNLGVRVRHIITYSLSPYEQRAFAGVISKGVPNIVRRFMEEIPFILPGLGTAALVYYFGNKDFARRQRKNPADYENEE